MTATTHIFPTVGYGKKAVRMRKEKLKGILA